jgi:hypothetical protein
MAGVPMDHGNQPKSDRLGRLALRRAGIAAVVILAGWLLFDFVNPLTAPWYPHCLVQRLTGWSCPGCGTSRAFAAIIHGDVAGAWQANPVTLVVLPVLTGLWITARLERLRLRLWVLLAVVVAGFTVWRNLPASAVTEETDYVQDHRN